jgi:hypothetical protein
MKAILELELKNQPWNCPGEKVQMDSKAPSPSSCRPLRQQLCHSKQIIGGSHEPPCQLCPELSLKPCLPKPSNHLDPAPNLFNPFPNPLTDLVARMTRCPAINRRSSSSLRILSHVRRNLSAPEHGHKALRVIPLIRSQGPRTNPLAPLPLQHRLGSFLLRRARSLGDPHVHQKTIAILHQEMSSIAEFRLLPSTLAHQPTLRIRRRLMGLVASLLPMKVHRGIPRVSIGRSLRAPLSLGPETLQARPSFDQCPVHRKVIVTHQSLDSTPQMDIFQQPFLKKEVNLVLKTK